MSLYLFSLFYHKKKRAMAGDKMEGLELGLIVWHKRTSFRFF